MEIINIAMEQNEEESDAFNSSLLTKKASHSSSDIQQNEGQQQTPLGPSFCYKYQNNITPLSQLNESHQTIWWKDTCPGDGYTEPSYFPENAPPVSYSLINQPLESHLTNQHQDTDLDVKEIMKSKHQKASITINEHGELVKRTKHPEQWKVNIKKNARLRGEEYTSVGGKLVPAKIMGPPCKCRMRCSEKVDDATREELHSIFWKTCNWVQRKQYIALSVKESPKQRTRCRGNVKSEHRRQITFTYSLLIKDEFITVCKCMFLSTFAVSEKFVRHAMDKKRTAPGGIIGPDLRGRHTPKTKKSESVRDCVRDHIKSFSAERSDDPDDDPGKKYLDSSLSIAAMHKLYVIKCKETSVPDSDIVKESYYREMFKTEFNLGFKRAKTKDIVQVQSSDSIGINGGASIN